MSWNEQQVTDTVNAVIAKANEDAEFRALAVSDVYAAIKQATGHEVPKEFKINLVDATGYHATIVLPEARGAEDELTETELESVAGGSKDGANDFFNGVGRIAEGAANTAIRVGENIGDATADRIRNS
ncbi:NHLP leader peptide family RiPP precursor [Paenibacillus amylolyticus]|uniref:NHLP leader peptide family RiPP precursor n=1 Tax=Paenibacillus amylolyticus TaxID=1451 RepID=UPI003EB90596